MKRPSLSVFDCILLIVGLLQAALVAEWFCNPRTTLSIEHLNKVVTSPTVRKYESEAYKNLASVGIQGPYPDLRDILLIFTGSVGALIYYYIFFGRRHKRKRDEITDALKLARDQVRELEGELLAVEKMERLERKGKKKIRILMDGAFDLMHYGHMNAFRLGKSLGHELVVGVNSTETIAQCKGPPVMTDEERCKMVSSCRFVDEVVPKIPYVMTDEYLHGIMEKYNIDYVVHGDDPVIVDGKDVYAHVKKMGKYRSIPRTEGVSTTDIVGRMLLCTSQTLARIPSSRFMKTSSIMSEFLGTRAKPTSDQTIVYIDGDWDMFNAEHVESIIRAKANGDFLIVGVHNDELVAKKSTEKGNFPIMDLHERVLSVMGCKFVDDVLIDAPWRIESDMISSLGINVVVPGPRYSDTKEDKTMEEKDRYEVPRNMKMLKNEDSSGKTSATPAVHQIVKRIQDNRLRFQKKIKAKKAKEDAYYAKRYGRKTGKEGAKAS